MSLRDLQNLYNNGQFGKCRIRLEIFVRRFPDNADAWALLGYCYDQLGHLRTKVHKNYYFRKARVAFRKLERLGQSAKAKQGLATVALHSGQYKEALRQYKEAFRMSRSKLLFLSIGNAQRHLGNHSTAIQWYRKFLKHHPNSWQAWSNIAFAQQEAGHVGAKSSAKKALTRMPKLPHSQIAKIVKELERF